MHNNVSNFFDGKGVFLIIVTGFSSAFLNGGNRENIEQLVIG